MNREEVAGLFRNYLKQKLELGEKTIYKPFDMKMQEQNIVEARSLNIDEFDKAESLDELYQAIHE